MAQTSKYSFQLFIDGVLFADITSIAESRAFSITRNRPDEINFTLDLDKLNSYAQEIGVSAQDILQVGRAEVRVSRQGVVLIAGQLITWDANLGTDRKIDIHAKGWLELLKFRLSSALYSNQTANFIARDLISTTLAKTYGNVSGFDLSLGTQPTLDNTNTYISKQFDNKSIYDAIVEMSEEGNGFDFEVTWDKKFNLYHPRIGIERDDVIFVYPGNVKNIKITRDTTKMFNYLVARGQGYGGGQAIINDQDSSAQQIYGLREVVKDYSDILDTTQLTNLADSDISIYKNPVVIHEVVVDGSQDPQVGSYHIGDKVRVIAKVLSLYSDLNTSFTIDKIDVKIDNNDQEEITLTLE